MSQGEALLAQLPLTLTSVGMQACTHIGHGSQASNLAASWQDSCQMCQTRHE